MFTRVYLCLPLFTRACLAMFTHVYLFTYVYSCDYHCSLMFTVFIVFHSC